VRYWLGSHLPPTIMPNKPRPENRHRMVRVEDELWEAAKLAAAANNTTISQVVRDALKRYVARN
jgi:predicted HicB family RNase H-like nuclease